MLRATEPTYLGRVHSLPVETRSSVAWRGHDARWRPWVLPATAAPSASIPVDLMLLDFWAEDSLFPVGDWTTDPLMTGLFAWQP
jgi:hypothetical protein